MLSRPISHAKRGRTGIFLGRFLLGGLLLAAAPVQAETTTMPERISVNGQTLRLHGEGIRSVLFIDVYRCALYLPRKNMPVEEINNSDTASAFQLKVIYADPPDTMPDAWRATLRSELSDRLFRRVRNTYRDLEKDDVLKVIYAKGAGTRISINGEHLLTDPGYGLMAEFLDMWLGANPVSEGLKSALTGGDDGNRL